MVTSVFTQMDAAVKNKCQNRVIKKDEQERLSGFCIESCSVRVFRKAGRIEIMIRNSGKINPEFGTPIFNFTY